MRSMTVISGYKVEEATMKTRNQSRLASVLSLLVGIWVVLSPIWTSLSGGALASTIITGIVIMAASVAQYFWNNVVPSWIMGLAAVWLLISTMLYAVSAAAAWSQILSAIAVAVLAYWDALEVTHLQSSDKHHHIAA